MADGNLEHLNPQIDQMFAGTTEKDIDEDLKFRLLACLDEYDDNKMPPRLDFAITHMKCTKIGKSIDVSKEEDLKFEICPCCGFVEHKEYDLKVPTKQISNYGPTIPLFFQFSKFIMIITAVLAVFGLYSQYATISANCSTTCSLDLNTLLNIEKREKDADHSRIAPLIHLATVLSIVVLLLVFYRSQFRLAQSIDEGMVSPSDYTLMLDNIPSHLKEEKDLEAYVQLYFLKHKLDSVQVEKINYARFEGNIVKKASQIQKLKEGIESIDHTLETEQDSVVRTTLFEKKSSLEYSLKIYEEEIEHYRRSLNKNHSLKNNVVAFVTLSTPLQVSKLIKQESISNSFLNGIMKYIPLLSFLKGTVFQRAPEPDDIIWRYIGYSERQRLGSVIVGYLASGVLIAISFGLQLGIRLLQNKYIKQISDDPDEDDGWMDNIYLQAIQLLSAVLINSVNYLICVVLRTLSEKEKHLCLSQKATSATCKLVLVFFANSALITLTLYYFGFDTGKIQGLILSIFYLLISTLIMNPFLYLMDPYYFYLVYLRVQAAKALNEPGKNDYKMTPQKEFNAIFEHTQLDLGEKYGTIIKTYFITCFFFYILPIGPVISGLYLICQFWTDKYLILRRSSKIPRLSKELSLELAEFAELSVLLFSLGNIIFRYKLRGDVSNVDVACVILSGLVMVLPLVGSVAVTTQMTEGQPQQRPQLEKKTSSILEEENHIR